MMRTAAGDKGLQQAWQVTHQSNSTAGSQLRRLSSQS